jgi:hypothetical protein
VPISHDLFHVGVKGVCMHRIRCKRKREKSEENMSMYSINREDEEQRMP